MKILLTGAAGYIGSHVAKQLLEETNHSIFILDNLSSSCYETIKTLRLIREFEFIQLDLKEFDSVKSLLQKSNFDAIIHFAASIIAPESVTNPLKYYLNNTVNTTNLIDCAIKSGVKKFIFSSTAAVYGNANNNPIDEEAPTIPINPYGTSKLMSEWVLKDAANANLDFKYIILRYFNVAGADIKGRIGQSTPNATHLIKVASQTALGKREKLYIFGDDYETKDGTCIRDYIHVDDLANAHVMTLEYLKDNDSDIFNVGYGHGYSVKEVIEVMKKVSKVDFNTEVTSKRVGDPEILIANNSKIKQKMGWKPKYDDLEFICKSALEWERNLK